MFRLQAQKTCLTVTERETVTTGSVNVYRCHFEFSSEDWKGLTKFASFRVGDETRSVPLNDAGECVLPREILHADAANRPLYAGVYGLRGPVIALPTVWTSLGVVQPGTVLGFPAYDAVNAGPRVEMEKRRNGVLRVNLHGLEGYTAADRLALHLYQASRRRGTRFRWRHPANFDAPEDSDRWGYGLLAGRNVTLPTGRSVQYPAVPVWMPNNGFLQTEIPVTDEILANGYLELDLLKYLLPLRKPSAWSLQNGDEGAAWENFSMIGLSANTDRSCSHLFRFHLVRDGMILARCENTLRVKIPANDYLATYISIY